MRRIYQSIQSAWSTLMPPRCCVCEAAGDDGMDLCVDCRCDLPTLDQHCTICAEPLTSGQVCGRCQRDAPAFDQVIAGFAYGQPVDHLIGQLKFARRQSYGRLLAQLMQQRLAGVDPPQCLLPVPLHPTRQAARGFNQSAVIAIELARRCGVAVDHSALRKIRKTTPQMELDAKARRRNLRGAFAIKPGWPPVGHVAIVDDVMTTGATANELARILKQAGVARVDVWVCARA